MAQLAERSDTLLSGFEALNQDPAMGRDGLAAARQLAFNRFVRTGFPTTQDEEWRFTNLAPLAALALERAATATVDAATLSALVPIRAASLSLTIVNGRLVGPVPGSLQAGLSVRTLRDARPDALLPARPAVASVLTDLNTAFFDDLVVIEIAPKAVVRDPIVITVVSVPGARPSLVSPRIVVVAGEASEASIVEAYADTGSGDPVFVNAVVDIRVAPGAILDHVKLQQQGATSFHLASMFVNVGRSATFVSHAITLGGRISRNDIVSVLDGDGAECTLNGLYVAGGDALVDTHTTIDHAQPHCPSHEVYKGILTGRARAVFNGKIIVRPDAQKTDAKQTNKALLLTDDAQINAKPQLEILADDVKCTHGATVGQLDEDALFYLKARGVGAIDARNMLIHAFAGDVLNGVKFEELRHTAMARVEQILGLPAD
jgi:Fe-S cluster assembly protein SufD